MASYLRLSSLLVILSLSSFSRSQSIPGASYFAGNGIPGAGKYQLIDDYEPSIFFNKFNFYSSYDPTYGHVQYVNQTVATQNGFVTTTNAGTAKISVDTTNKWPRGGPGRPSVRVISDNTYTHGLFVLDAVHMPWGCGTWPAYWLLGPNWPYTGEIDIIEGVNTNTQDSISLHSSANCTVAGTGQTGTLQTTNCDSNANGNSGCGSTLSNTTIPNNYGNAFNTNGGGVYVTEWTSSYFKTWFFARGNIPSSITNGAPDPSTFGTPAVNHQGSCNIDQHFTNMSIIINTDFCGAWAGQVYSQYGDCPQNTSTSSLNSCVDFVGNNPSYFTNAYWEINSIRVYQMPAGATPTSSYTTSLSSASVSVSTNSINLGMGQSTTGGSSVQYTGPVSSLTASSASATATPVICPSYNNTLWTDSNKQAYTIGCGLDYNGGGAGLPGNGVYSAVSFENCLEICDSTTGCIAVAFVGGNGAGTCYAKSSNGAFIYSGAVNAAIRANAVSSSVTASSAQASGSNTPTCPGAASSTFTDSQGVPYGIVCYTDYTGNNIGSPISMNTLAACLPACDSMSGCTGVVFNTFYNLCQLKSSFTGSQTGNNSVVAARRNAVVALSSSSSHSSSTSTLAYGYGGNGYGYNPPPGYNGNGYGVVSTSQKVTTTTTTTTSSSSRQTTSSSLLSTTYISSTSTVVQVSSSRLAATTISITTSSSSSAEYYSTQLSMPSPIVSSSTMSPTTVMQAQTTTSSILHSSTASTASTALPSTSQVGVSTSSAGFYSTSISTTFPLSSTLLSSTTSLLSSVSSLGQTSSSAFTLTSSSLYLLSSAAISTMTSLSSSSSISYQLGSASPLSSTLLIPSTASSSSQQYTTTSSAQQVMTTLSITSTSSPSQLPGMSTVSSITSAAACPTNSAALCGSQQSTTCSDSAGAIYFVSCGIVYTGDIIDTSGVYGRELQLLGRATEPDIGSCQRLCDRTNMCVAFNYIDTNCVLLSRVTSGVSNANAIGGSLVQAAPSAVSTSSSTVLAAYGSGTSVTSSQPGLVLYGSSTSTPSSSSLPALILYGSSTSTLAISAGSQATSSTAFSPTSLATITTTLGSLTAGTYTVVTTITTSVPPGGYYTSASSGSFYVYPSSSVSGSASLCFTCALTPTVVTTPISGPPTCSAVLYGTTTVFTTSTITSCAPQPTCPASGFLIVGGSQSYPGQQVVTTTDRAGQQITYTQIASSPSGNGGSGNGSTSALYTGLEPGSNGGTGSGPASAMYTGFGSGGNTTNYQPVCPAADGTIYTDSMGMRYRIDCETTFTDETLDTQSQSTLAGCIASCDMYNTKTFYLGTQCLGVSWYSNLTTDNCLLKSGNTATPLHACDSCALLTGNTISNNTVGFAGPGGQGSAFPSGYGTVTYTTVIGGTTAVSTYTTTLPASTITIYSTIYTTGATIATSIGYSTIPASTVVGTTTNVISGSTIVTERPAGPGYYGGDSGDSGSGSGGVGSGYTGVASTIYGVSTAVSTYISNGQTIYSTYGVTTAQSVVYLTGPTQTQTVTTTSVSISLVPTTIVTTLSQGYTTTIITYVPAGGGGGYYGGGGGGGGGSGGTQTQTVTTTSVSLSISVQLLPTTIITTVSQGYTTTYVTYIPVTYTQQASGGTGGGGGSGGGTVTVTQSGSPATTVYVTLTVTETILPASSSSSFTCRTYATNYLNGLHGRAEPTSAPMMKNGMVLEPVLPALDKKKSIFDKEVIMGEIARVPTLQMGILSAEFDLWYIE